MAKIIKYMYVANEINHGTEENPNIEQIILSTEIICHTKAAYDANYPIVEKEAVDGTIEVSGEFDDETIEPTAQDDTDAILIDHEYRLTLLELFSDTTA